MGETGGAGPVQELKEVRVSGRVNGVAVSGTERKVSLASESRDTACDLGKSSCDVVWVWGLLSRGAEGTRRWLCLLRGLGVRG